VEYCCSKLRERERERERDDIVATTGKTGHINIVGTTSRLVVETLLGLRFATAANGDGGEFAGIDGCWGVSGVARTKGIDG